MKLGQIFKPGRVAALLLLVLNICGVCFSSALPAISAHGTADIVGCYAGQAQSAEDLPTREFGAPDDGQQCAHCVDSQPVSGSYEVAGQENNRLFGSQNSDIVSGFYWDKELCDAQASGSQDDGYAAVFAAAPRVEYVYLGGTPLGLELSGKGLIVIGKTDVITAQGLTNPTKDSDIQTGDIVTHAEGIEVNSSDALSELINSQTYRGKKIQLTIRKKSGGTVTTYVTPALDAASGKYRTGLFVRQDSVGIGTLTFVRQNLRFAALGHPVIDGDTQDILDISMGRALGCTIAGSIPGERGKPGELKGIVLKQTVYGVVDKNCKFGIYGQFSRVFPGKLNSGLIETLPRTQVKPGKAQIYTTVSGSQPRLYDIEIVKTAYQSRPADRSMVIRITDNELLAQTGGIVQGMSGSPIIQDGKLAGAVTHVFINDPTRGYGLYADWMLDM